MTTSGRDDEDVVPVSVSQTFACLECVCFCPPACWRKVGRSETDFHGAHSFLPTSGRPFFSVSISSITRSHFLQCMFLYDFVYDFVRFVGLVICQLGKSLCSNSPAF